MVVEVIEIIKTGEDDKNFYFKINLPEEKAKEFKDKRYKLIEVYFEK